MLGDDHDLIAHRRDVVGAARAGQPDPRLRGVADDAAVDVAVLVDLRASDEPVVEEAPLSHQEDIRCAGEHLGADGGADLVGRGRQLTWRQLDADHPALEEHGEVRRLAPLGDRSGHQRLADPCEERLPSSSSRLAAMVMISFGRASGCCTARPAGDSVSEWVIVATSPRRFAVQPPAVLDQWTRGRRRDRNVRSSPAANARAPSTAGFHRCHIGGELVDIGLVVPVVPCG